MSDYLKERDAAMAMRAKQEAIVQRGLELDDLFSKRPDRTQPRVHNITPADSLAENLGFIAATFNDPPARRTDPGTSWKAAREFVESGKRDTAHKKIVRFLLATPTAWTATEIQEASGIRSVHKRMKELETRGYVVRGMDRTCRITGKLAVTWKAA